MGTENGKLKSALSSALSETLETLAFLETLPLGEDAPPEAEMIDIQPRRQVVWVRIPMVAPVPGSLTMILSPELGHMLTEMMFGSFGDKLSNELMLDAVAETTNVVAGRFLDHLLGGGKAFELGLPEKDQATADNQVPMPDDVRVTLDYAVERHKMTVVLAGSGL